MKTIVLIRHAKSDWPEGVDDFDRPLTPIGQEHALQMSQFLHEKINNIDYFVSSPARRAKDTCAIFAKQYERMATLEPELYNAREKHFENLIYALPNHIKTVAFFSHNPGISNFANMVTSELINLPTCGIVAYNINCDEWSNFEIAKKEFLFFQSPKLLNKK